MWQQYASVRTNLYWRQVANIQKGGIGSLSRICIRFQLQSEPLHILPIFADNRKTIYFRLPFLPSADYDCLQTVRGWCPWFPLSHLWSCSSSTMEGNDDSDIIEHHVEEDMEKKDTRSHAVTSSFLDSVTPSDRDAHSGTQSSHRLLAYSDALISIIATVMVMYRAQGNRGVSGNRGSVPCSKFNMTLIT